MVIIFSVLSLHVISYIVEVLFKNFILHELVNMNNNYLGLVVKHFEFEVK